MVLEFKVQELRVQEFKVQRSYEEGNLEDADSDSDFDSDGNRYYAGRNQLYGTRTDSTAVGRTDTKAHKGRVPSV